MKNTLELDVLKIVREDILRILSENKNRAFLENVKSEIKVSAPFVAVAVKKLEKENLMLVEDDFLKLTKEGEEKAREILRRHLIIENYFKKTRAARDAHKIAHILEHYISEEVIKNIKKLSTLREGGIALTEFGLKKVGIIANLAIPDSRLFERIVSMGIFPGEEIEIVGQIPNAVIIKIKDKKFALDKDIAREVQIYYEEA